MNHTPTCDAPKLIRQSNFEALRIVAMVFIMLYHIWVHVSYPFWTPESANFILVNSFGYLGKVGVDCFVMISGYFLIKSDGYSHRKGVRLWLEILFYSVAWFVVWCVVWDNEPTADSVVRTLMPLTFNTWWFATAYFVLFVFHPLLNRLIEHIDRETHLKAIVVALVLWSVAPMVMRDYAFDYSVIPWFFTLYFIAAYIRLYPERNGKSPARYGLYVLACMAVSLGLTAFYAYNPPSTEGAFRLMGLTREMFSPLIVVFSVNMFLMFRNLDLGRRKGINIIASTMFGVYLIHEWGTGLIWNDVWHPADVCNEPTFALYILMMLVVTFTVCIVIDLGRQYVLEKPLGRYIDSLGDRLGSVTKRVFAYISGHF